MLKRRRGGAAQGLRWFAGILGTFLFVVLGIYTALVIFVIAVRKMQGFREWMRLFNKRTLNPATLKTAGQRGQTYSIVHHIGRRSGTPYTTPVLAASTSDGFVIPLPYGKDVDWCRNTLAAGRCTITYDGQNYATGEPEVIDGATALSLLQSPRSLIWRALGIGKNQFLQVKMLADSQETMPAAASPAQPVTL